MNFGSFGSAALCKYMRENTDLTKRASVSICGHYYPIWKNLLCLGNSYIVSLWKNYWSVSSCIGFVSVFAWIAFQQIMDKFRYFQGKKNLGKGAPLFPVSNLSLVYEDQNWQFFSLFYAMHNLIVGRQVICFSSAASNLSPWQHI